MLPYNTRNMVSFVHSDVSLSVVSKSQGLGVDGDAMDSDEEDDGVQGKGGRAILYSDCSTCMHISAVME